jgi:L-asparaginase/Glu-tRNA(Gln) amidotransferase subunit D
MTSLPRVAVFTLGGTIASSADSGGAATVRITGPELLDSVPQASGIATIEVHSVKMVPSGDLRLPDLFELRSLIETAVESGVEGVVVTQGTDTLEETSYALELITELDVPIVFTGAMRNSSIPGSDGPANLLAAIRVAASPRAWGWGRWSSSTTKSIRHGTSARATPVPPRRSPHRPSARLAGAADPEPDGLIPGLPSRSSSMTNGCLQWHRGLHAVMATSTASITCPAALNR